MSIRASLIVLFLIAFVGADVNAQSSRGRRGSSRRSKVQEKPLAERDPVLFDWINTLVLNLQKDHRVIRNSAAQALIAVGAEAAPALMELRERSTSKQRRIINRIMERITRGSGRNLFKADAGGQPPTSLAGDIGRVLKLSPEKVKQLKGTITTVQEKRRVIEEAFRKKTIKVQERMDRVQRLKSEVEAELSLFLDREAVDYVTLRLGLNPRAAKERKPKEREDALERRRRRNESGGH